MTTLTTIKKILLCAALSGLTAPAMAADVGVSISIGQPGFYGRIDIGDYPYPIPRVIYSRPVVVYPHVGVVYEPLYLRVPPGHMKNWKNYCGRYEACGYPVYFVRDSWYHNEYAPIYRERHSYDDRHYDGDDDRHGHKGNRGHGNGREKGRN